MGWFTDNVLGIDPNGGGLQGSAQHLVNDPLDALKGDAGQLWHDVKKAAPELLGYAIAGFPGAVAGWYTAKLVPKPPQYGPASPAIIQLDSVTNVAKIPVVYGTRTVGGTIVFANVVGQYLYLVVVLCEGEVSAINTVYLDNVATTDARFSGLVTVNKHTGTTTQTADSTLTTDCAALWASTAQLKGVAYITLKLKYDANAFSGLPTITANVTGKKVYDPRENLLTYSEALTNAIWNSAPAHGTITADAAAAPDGTMSAESFIENTDATTGRYIAQNVAFSNGTVYTLSVYAKIAVGTRYLGLVLPATEFNNGVGSGFAIACFTLSGNGAYHLDEAELNTTAGIELVGNGWYRCWITSTATASGTTGIQIRLSNSPSNGTAAYTGDGTSGLYLWGAQINNGALKAYAKTTAAAISPQTAFSANPALCIRDFLTNSIYGKGLDATDHGTDVDDDAIITAADLCDVSITEYTSGPSIAQFECNAYIDTAQTVMDNLKALLTSCRGFLSFYQGQYHLRIERDETAVMDFNSANMFGQQQIGNGGRRDRLNQVKVIYADDANGYQAGAYIEDDASLRTTEDGNMLLSTEITLPCETNQYRSQWHANYILKKSRQQITNAIIASPEALRCVPGDIVTRTDTSLGWSAKTFRVLSLNLRLDCLVELALAEHEPTVYDRTVPAQATPPADTTMPSPFTVSAPTGLTLASGSAYVLITGDQTIQSRIYATWTAPGGMFDAYYELQWKITSSSDWHLANPIPIDQTSAYIGPVQDGVDYTVQIRTVNSLGVRSAWSSTTHTVASINYHTNIAFHDMEMPSAQLWADIAWNGSVFCAIASNLAGTTVAATSPDGIIWTARTLPASVNWQAIAWNGSVFCAIASGTSTAATSPDGITWTSRTMPSSQSWSDIAWNGSVFCAIVSSGGGSNVAATSPDGITWTARTLPASITWKAIGSDGSQFCLLGTSTQAATSPDGITWTSRTLPSSQSWADVAWNGTVFCAIAVSPLAGGETNVAATSPDGITWTARTMPLTVNWQKIAWNGTVFCAVASSQFLCATSPDGITWKLRPVPGGNGHRAIASDGQKFCAPPYSTTSTIGATSLV